MYGIKIKWWLRELFKTISVCAIPLEINQWNIHCFTPVNWNNTCVTTVVQCCSIFTFHTHACKFVSHTLECFMGLLPDTQICGCACAGNAGKVFPVTTGKRSRHASRHVRHARAVMHAGIANQRFPLKSAVGENVPGIPGACATCNFTYLVRGPLNQRHEICVVHSKCTANSKTFA